MSTAVIVAGIVAVIATAGAAAPFIMAGVVAYGTYQIAKTGTELITGKDDFGQGRELSEEEKWSMAGGLAGGIVGGGVGAKLGIKFSVKIFSGGTKVVTQGIAPSVPAEEFMMKDLE